MEKWEEIDSNEIYFYFYYFFFLLKSQSQYQSSLRSLNIKKKTTSVLLTFFLGFTRRLWDLGGRLFDGSTVEAIAFQGSFPTLSATLRTSPLFLVEEHNIEGQAEGDGLGGGGRMYNISLFICRSFSPTFPTFKNFHVNFFFF